jgi:ketosteroid isomerase-like protein
MRKTKTNLLFTLAIISISVLCCKPEAKEETVAGNEPAKALDLQWAKHFLDSVNTKFSEQFKAGDSVALAALYWPDAEILLSNMEPIKGDQILAAWGSMTRMGIPYFTFSTTDIRGDAQYMIETGNYEMKDAKQTLVDRGKYVVVYEQRNGVWKLIRDMGNTSLPAAK